MISDTESLIRFLFLIILDTNECLSSNGDCEQTCVNVVASHYCVCGPGYVLAGNDRNCNDINECLTNNAGCDHDCFNNIGSYTCDCQVGYLLHDDDHSCHGNLLIRVMPIESHLYIESSEHFNLS